MAGIKGNDSRQPVISDSMLSTVLWAIGKLLPHHPTACRPFIGQIRSLVLPLIAPTPSCLSIDGSRSEISGTVCSEITAQRARHVLILLSGCAAKNTQSHEWAAFLSTVIETAHRTADLVFGALLEDWEPLDQNSRYNRREPESSTGTVGSPDDQSGLPDWEGISAGLERLNGLLLTIQAHLTLATTVAVNTPVGKIVNLIDRMLSALPPSEEGSKDAGQGTRTNPEIGRNERETLWTGLPDLHVSAMQILEHLIVRLEEGAMALDYRFLEYVLWVFEHEHAHIQIRKAVYSVVALLLPRCRPGIPRTIASSLERCVRISCEDLLPVQRGSMSSNGDRDISHAGVSKDSSSADAYSKNPRASSAPSTGPSEVQRMAEHMLCLALAHLPPSFLRLPVRSKIDQTAILAQSQLMLRSSVLNAPALHMREQQSSLMPLLARQFPQDQGTEALIRPRLPPIQQSTNDGPTDSPLEAEDAERIFEEGARRSSTIHAVPRDIHLATDIESEKQEQTTPSAQLPPIDAPPREALPATDPFSEPDQRALGSTIPTKRSRELDPDGMNGTALDRLEHLLTPGAEPVSKRHREETGDMYIPPASEDVIPSSTVTAPPEDLIPRLTNLSAFSKPLADLRNINDGMDDDDSDDSSIPAIDPTLATDDEEEDDDESADELARE